MSFGGLYNSIREMIPTEVLQTPLAKGIARKGGLRATGARGFTRPTTILRAEGWNHYEGTPEDPVTGDTYFFIFSNRSRAIPNDGIGTCYYFVDGVSQARVTCRTVVPHATARVHTGWSAKDEDTSFQWLTAWPDSAEPVVEEDGLTNNYSGALWAPMSEEYNSSGWVDINLDVFHGKDVFMQMMIRDTADIPAVLGLCELQLR